LNGGIDPSVAVDGHVGPSVKQKFTVLRTRKVVEKRLSLEAAEFLLRDQFGNAYLSYQAVLMDNGTYAVTDWIGKVAADGSIKPVREFKRFGSFSDDMIDFCRRQAFVAFGRTVLDILKSKQAAGAAYVLSADEAKAAATGIVTDIMATAKPATKILDAPKTDEQPVAHEPERQHQADAPASPAP
jgi:hypothetical protein